MTLPRTLPPQSVYLGQDRHGYHHTYRERNRAYVLGGAYGPQLLAVTDSIEEALDEFDERHGQRVDFADEFDLATIADYDGDTIDAKVESAMGCGDVRMNDGGTMVFVDHYEWIREFDSIRDAARFWRTGE